MNTENTEYFTVREVAEKLHFSVSTVHKMLKERVIPYVKWGNTVRIKKTTIETIVKENYVPRKRKERAYHF